MVNSPTAAILGRYAPLMKSKSIITLLALIAVVNVSCGQTIKDERTILLESIQKKSSNFGKLQDTALLRTMASIYGDSILVQMDNILSDTAFIKNFDTTYEKDKVKGMLSKYNIEDIEAMVGPMNDYGEIFTNAELKYLDSVLYHHFENSTTLVTIVTLDSSILKGRDFDDKLMTIQEKWDICNFGEKNILIGIMLRPTKIKIVRCSQTSQKLSVDECDKIINELMTPSIIQRKYFEGTKRGLLEILSLIE